MIEFVKYHGTGNDFILLDGRTQEIPKLDVAQLCHRRFGIGADGLMIIRNKVGYDFEMVYYNSDGELSSMCGNGGRCIAHWAWKLGIANGTNQLQFWAPDGVHEAIINSDETVKLSMNDISSFLIINETDIEMDTGSPHYVRVVDTIPEDFIAKAKAIRHQDEYHQKGINVNFYSILKKSHIKGRTFERGVEDETWSCGTGATAMALHYAIQHHITDDKISIETLGGMLNVYFKSQEDTFTEISLEGPATPVFKGYI